jgi:hypothetical protein
MHRQPSYPSLGIHCSRFQSRDTIPLINKSIFRSSPRDTILISTSYIIIIYIHTYIYYIIYVYINILYTYTHTYIIFRSDPDPPTLAPEPEYEKNIFQSQKLSSRYWIFMSYPRLFAQKTFSCQQSLVSWAPLRCNNRPASPMCKRVKSVGTVVMSIFSQ